MKISNEIKKIIEDNALAVATVNGKKPHAIAVACVKVLGNKVIISDVFMRHTSKNLRNNGNIALVVWNKDCTGFEIVGTAKHYSSGKWLKFVKGLKENKELPVKGAIVVTVKEIKKLLG